MKKKKYSFYKIFICFFKNNINYYTIDDFLNNDSEILLYDIIPEELFCDISLKELIDNSDVIAIVEYKDRIQRSMNLETTLKVNKLYKSQISLEDTIVLFEEMQISQNLGLMYMSPMQIIESDKEYLVFLKYHEGFEKATFSYSYPPYSKFYIKENLFASFSGEVDMNTLNYNDVKQYDFITYSSDLENAYSFDSYYNQLEKLIKEINMKYGLSIEINK